MVTFFIHVRTYYVRNRYDSDWKEMMKKASVLLFICVRDETVGRNMALVDVVFMAKEWKMLKINEHTIGVSISDAHVHVHVEPRREKTLYLLVSTLYSST